MKDGVDGAAVHAATEEKAGLSGVIGAAVHAVTVEKPGVIGAAVEKPGVIGTAVHGRGVGGAAVGGATPAALAIGGAPPEAIGVPSSFSMVTVSKSVSDELPLPNKSSVLSDSDKETDTDGMLQVLEANSGKKVLLSRNKNKNNTIEPTCQTK